MKELDKNCVQHSPPAGYARFITDSVKYQSALPELYPKEHCHDSALSDIEKMIIPRLVKQRVPLDRMYRARPLFKYAAINISTFLHRKTIDKSNNHIKRVLT